MIGTALYKGQGFGNQLWVYAVVRTIAERRGFDFSIAQSSNFKGKDFLKLDFGIPSRVKGLKGPTGEPPKGFDHYLKEKSVLHPVYGCDISPLDVAVSNVSDGTFIDGYLQAENYIYEDKAKISDWFRVPGDFFDGCVISLRGGEYRNVPNLFLAKSYYDNAIAEMRRVKPDMKFKVVTDDRELAALYFPDFPVTSSGGVKIYAGRFYKSPPSLKIGQDFSAIQNAKYLILSNSSFSWWGAWTNQRVEKVIAPKYWAEHNRSDGYWSLGDSLTRGWDWLDLSGKIFNYQDCLDELVSKSI